MKLTLKTVFFLMLAFMFLCGCNIPIDAPDQSQAARWINITDNTTEDAKAFDTDGYFYSFWTNTPGSVDFTSNATGNYMTSWSNTGCFVAGKGKKHGSILSYVTYSASFNGGSNGYLALYGWMANPGDPNHIVVEYYIVENYGTWTPPGNGATWGGTVTDDSGTYNLYRIEKLDQAWIVNDQTGDFYQYWSIWTSKRTSGSIYMGTHVNGWKKAGWDIGNFGVYYQILATEGNGSSGSSNVTISEWKYKGKVVPRKK